MICGKVVAAIMHVGSWHSADWYDDYTPGIAARCESGLTLGVYRNSIGGNSAYAAVERSWGPVWAAVGMRTGYYDYPSPVAMAGLRWGSVRLGYAPKLGGHVDTHLLHLMIEVGL